MLSLFYLVPDLAPSGEAAPAWVIAAGLPRARFRVTVGVLGPATGSVADELRAANVAVLSLPIRHLLDLNGARRLRRAVRDAGTAVIHAWGPTAARLSRLLVSRREGENLPRLVVSAAAIPGRGLAGWFTARQARRADRVIPETRADGERYRQLGVLAEHLTLIAPAAPPAESKIDRAAILARLGLPPDCRLIVTGGKSEYGVGPKDAIVAFDMLRYDARDFHLVVFGAGSDSVALEQFGKALAFDDFRVHFAPCDPDRGVAARLATMVWVTNPRGGTDEALEAMAAGKPVIGWNTPELAEVGDDGVTGFLVPFGDRAALATKGRLLLDNPGTAERMGEAGRLRALERFTAARMVEQFGRLYAELV